MRVAPHCSADQGSHPRIGNRECYRCHDEALLLTPYTPNHARTVFVNDRLRKEIASYQKNKVTSDPSNPLFKTQKRSAFSANTLCQTLNGIYRRAGLDGATSHSGRRSFITQLASKGIGVRVLASLAGHKSIATTQAYIDVNDAMKRAAVELVS
jgi:integrase/recombinase XerD